jgi:hypothetical protein
MSYVPSLSSGDNEEYVRTELNRIAESFQLFEFLQLKVLNNEPERPRQGMLVYADGTNWDPGSGEGVYVYKSSWVLLG